MRIPSISAGVFALLIGAPQAALGQDAPYCRQTEGSAPQCFFKTLAECHSLVEKTPAIRCVQNPRLIDKANPQPDANPPPDRAAPQGSSAGEPRR